MCEFHESTCNGFGDIWWTDNPVYFSSTEGRREVDSEGNSGRVRGGNTRGKDNNVDAKMLSDLGDSKLILMTASQGL